MKCSIMLHFIWVFTVCKSTCLGASRMQIVKNEIYVCLGILGQVWYLIVLIPDLCTLTYFVKSRYKHCRAMFYCTAWTCLAQNMDLWLICPRYPSPKVHYTNSLTVFNGKGTWFNSCPGWEDLDQQVESS